MALYDDAKIMFLASAAAGLETKDASKVYNVKPAPITTGSELVTNGGFDADSDWTKSGEATISGGTGNIISSTGTYAALNQSSVFVIGKKYKISLDVTVNTNEHSFAIKLQDGAVDANIGKITTSGSYVFYHTAAGTTLTIARFSPNDGEDPAGNSATDVDVDNVSVFEVDTVPADFDISRDANLDATRVGPTGLIEKGREQLLLNTTFSGAVSNTSVPGFTVSGTGGTFGVANASGQLTFTASDETKRRYLVSPIQSTTSCLYTQSVFVDAVEGTVELDEIMRSNSSSNTTLIHNLEDGVVVGGSTVIQAGKRYSRTYTLDSSTTTFRFGIGANPLTNAGAASVTLSKPQLEKGLASTEYIENTSTSATVTAGLKEDEPRFDYPPFGGAPALLIEPLRKNEIKQSEYINGDSSDWTEGRVDTASNQTTSPEGLDNATKVTATVEASSNTKRIYSNTWSVADDEVWTASVFLKSDTANKIELRITSSTEAEIGFGQARFTADGNGTAEFDSSNQGDSVSITKLKNGWYRCTATGTLDSSLSGWTGTARMFIYVMDPDTGARSYVSDGTESVFVYGAQAEEGSSATSYIPTHGATATRSRDDVPAIDTSGFSFGTTCTIFYEGIINQATADHVRPITMFGSHGSPADAERYLLFGTSFSGTTYTLSSKHNTTPSSSLESTSLTKAGLTIGAKVKCASVFNGTSFKFFVNGALADSGGTATVTAASIFNSLDLSQVAADKNHTVGSIVLWGSALTDQQCIDLTTL